MYIHKQVNTIAFYPCKVVRLAFRETPFATRPCFPFPFWVSPGPHPRKNRPFLLTHLRGTHFASPLFSDPCMGGTVPPSRNKTRLLSYALSVNSVLCLSLPVASSESDYATGAMFLVD